MLALSHSLHIILFKFQSFHDINFYRMQLSSFSELKKWVSCNNIVNFDILLCIGNKADLVPGHSAHVEYRRRLLNLDESADYGISETEGSSLLGDEESPSEFKSSCMEWCLEHNIEYIEACASNPRFDKCKIILTYYVEFIL